MVATWARRMPVGCTIWGSKHFNFIMLLRGRPFGQHLVRPGTGAQFLTLNQPPPQMGGSAAPGLLAFLFWTWTVSTCFNSFQCCSDAARRCFSSNWASSQASQWLWSHVKSKVSLTLPAEYVTLNISEHLTLKSLTISAKTFPTTHSASFLNLLKPQMNNVFGIQTRQRPMTKHYKKHDKNCKHCKHCKHWRSFDSSFWLVLTRSDSFWLGPLASAKVFGLGSQPAVLFAQRVGPDINAWVLV